MRAEWQEIRQAALDVLKPDRKTLEHGLELHKNSYVFDAYGFTPRGVGCNERIRQLAEQGASPDELSYAREEFSAFECFKDPDTVQMLEEAWKMSGVCCNFQNSGIEGNDPGFLLRRLSFYTGVVDMLPELYERAVFPEQLPGIRERGHRAICMTTNGVPVSTTLNNLEESLIYIGIFYKLGVRMMHLTYNRRNLIGDGCAESSDAGLSDFGRKVIAEMNRVGVIPDVAHSGQRTSLEAAEISKKPVVASHAAVARYSTHYRAKKDEVIAAVKKSGGYVGICGHPPFLQGSMDLKAMLDHIQYVAENYGTDHVAIGTDNGVPLQTKAISMSFNKTRSIWESYWPAPGAGYEQMTKEQYASVNWLNWPIFTVGLVQRGFSDEDIRKIIGGNVIRVLKATLA